MDFRLSNVLLIPALVSASAAIADPPIVVQGQQPLPAPNAEKKIICRSTMQTGSRFATRKCETKLAWDNQEEEARRAAHEVIDRAVVYTGEQKGRGF